MKVRPQDRLVLGCALVVVLYALAVLILALAGALLARLGVESAVTRFRPQLLWAAGTLTVIWIGAMGAIRSIRQPRTPSTAPATSELRSEPPAIANMLVENFRATREAVSATLLDLAARGHVDIEGADPATTICRLRTRDDEGLTEYERMVMKVLRARSVDGVVPAGALTTGTEVDAREWWRDFRRVVEQEAKSRGLSRDIWDTRTLWSLTAVALLPSPLVGLAYFNLAAAIAALAPAITLLSIAKTRNRQRDTPVGLVAASEWLGVRRHLREDDAFPDLPPGAVTVWERYLAYGAALSVARGTVRALPLGAEDDHLAWSTHGGRWREVRVRYPTFWPPAWGWRPATSILVGALLVVGAGLLLRTAASLGWPRPDASLPPEFVTFLRGLIVAMWAVGAVALTWATPAVIRALSSLGPPRRISGQVVRLRTFGKSSKSPGRHYVAVDDGAAATVRAFLLPQAMWISSSLTQYADATALVIMPLGRLVSIEMSGPDAVSDSASA